MKTIVKGDQESKQTTVTFVIDWNEEKVSEKLNRILEVVNAEIEERAGKLNDC